MRASLARVAASVSLLVLAPKAAPCSCRLVMRRLLWVTRLAATHRCARVPVKAAPAALFTCTLPQDAAPGRFMWPPDLRTVACLGTCASPQAMLNVAQLATLRLLLALLAAAPEEA